MKNLVQDGKTLRLTVGSGIVAGDPVLVGALTGVAKTDYDAADAKAEINRTGVYSLTVKGADDSAPAAISEGDVVYYDAGDINVDATNGTKFGYVLEDVASGASPTVDVLLVQ